jgi:hypothetical protein
LFIKKHKKGEKLMHSRLNVQIRKVLLGGVLGGVALFHSSGASASIVSRVEQTAGKYYTVNAVTLSDGKILEETVIHGPPAPPPGFEAERQAVSLPEPDSVAGAKSLTVPAFNWVFGCSAVSGAMIAGYYDINGFPNIYTGPTNGGVMPLDNSSWPTWSDGDTTYPNCPLIASKNEVDGRTTKGSIDDYWVQYNSTAQDPYITSGWTQHTWGDAIGDYMMTSQSAFNNSDGGTSFWSYKSSTTLTCDEMASSSLSDGTLGRKHFYEARGYTVTDCYNQKTDNIVAGGFSFAQFKAEIDAGNPVMLNLEGHTIVGVGYDDSANTVYIHDTWDYQNHTMTWGGSYSNMALQSVSIVHLASSATSQLTVTKGGNKQGTVAAEGLTCSGDTCTGTYPVGASVTLTATAATGSLLNGWTGCDSVSGNSCTVAMTADKSISANFVPTSALLTVTKGGNKQGRVTANGLTCSGDTCTGTYTGGASVTLTATAATGSYFYGWTGCDSVSGNNCTVAMTADKSISANFASTSAQLTVTKGGNKQGTVAANGLTCSGDTCTGTYTVGASVTLTATAATGSYLNGWTGCDSVSGNSCTVAMTADKSISANFASTPALAQLTVTKGGNKQGTVTANGLTCSGNTCTGTYPGGASVTITATAANKSFFNGWTGCDSVSDNLCTVSMTADKKVTAAFTLPPKITVSPMSLNFGSLRVDATSSKRAVKIKNNASTGGSALTLSSMSLSGTNASEFALDTSCPSTLNRGSACMVYVTATPSSTTFGSKTAVLAINSNDPNKELVSVKLAAKAAPPVLSVSSKSLNFGKMAVGAPSLTKRITIKNTGLSDLNITSITLGGTDSASFAQTNSCSVVPRGSSCAVNATFTPASTGAMSATLSIVSNAPKNGTITVKLAGTGK